MKSYVTRVVIERSSDGRFVATSPDAQGCVAVGGSSHEAVNKLKQSLKVYFGSKWHSAPDRVPPKLRQYAKPTPDGEEVAAVISWPLNVLKSDAFGDTPPTQSQIAEE